MLQKTICKHLLIAFTLCASIGGEATAYAKDKLRPEEQKVLTYLLADWGKDYSVTSVDIAMRAVKVKDTDETRFRIGSHIKAHPELHEVIRRWGWVTLVLTPNEKLIARALVNAERDGKPAPSIGEIAKAVGITEDQVKRSLSTLERYEIIRRSPSRGGAGFDVITRYLKWEPRLDFLFHQVTLADGRQFNTNWAIDFMLLVSSKFSSDKVVIDDSSPEGTSRIHVVFEQGKLASADPASTILFMGGGWGIINLFRSEEALNQWLTRYPELKEKQRGTIPEALEEIKRRQNK